MVLIRSCLAHLTIFSRVNKHRRKMKRLARACFQRRNFGTHPPRVEAIVESRPSTPKMAERRYTVAITTSISTGPNPSSPAVIESFPVNMNYISIEYIGQLMSAKLRQSHPGSTLMTYPIIAAMSAYWTPSPASSTMRPIGVPHLSLRALWPSIMSNHENH